MLVVGVGRSAADQIFFEEDNPYLGYETGWDTIGGSTSASCSPTGSTRGRCSLIEYDDRYQQADQIERDTNGDWIDDRFFFTTDVKRTNRAVFTKLQYLFRY